MTPGTFDLWVDTLPWTLYQGLTIEESSSTIAHVQLGAIRVLTPEGEATTADRLST